MSHAEDVQKYIDGVLDGSIVTGRLERLAVHRHVADLKLAGARGFEFVEKYAIAAIDFAGICNQFEGQYAGQPLRLRPEQKFLVWCLFGWRVKATGLRRFRHVQCEVGRKWGKALALDTPIPTPTGWTTMGEIQPGDTVFDENGKLCSVVACTEIMRNRPCYRVGFSDGTSIIADAEHEWLTETKYSGVARAGRKRVPSGTSYRVAAFGEDGVELSAKAIRTTEEISKSVKVCERGKYSERNHRITLTAPLQLPDADLPINPYVLGAWLGDGHSACARITIGDADQELVQHLENAGVSVSRQKHNGLAKARNYQLSVSPLFCGRGHVLADTGIRTRRGHIRCKCCDRMVTKARQDGSPIPERTNPTIQERLRHIGVLNNKHIPRTYLRASAQQRWDLLAGLMDTDGHVSCRNRKCEFTSVNRRLAEDFLELARSLGLKASMNTGRATINGRDCGEKYRVIFSPPAGAQVCRLKRKQSRLDEKYSKPCNSAVFIDSVEPVSSVPVRCIQVDSASHLYLAGENMVPTHNSTLVAYLCCLLLYADWPLEQGAQGYVAATKLDQAAIVWEHAKNMIQQSPALKKRAHITEHNHKIKLPDLKSTFMPLAADKTPDGFNPHFIIKDEEHAWRENHRGQADTLRSGFGARSQPLTITITTYGDDESVLWLENHDYAVKILESVITGEIVNDSWLCFICALDYPNDQPCYQCKGDECPWCGGTGTIPPDDPYDEKVWRKANPGIGNEEGCTPKLDRMREDAVEARGKPSYEPEFFQKNCQIKVASRNRFTSPDAWMACKGELSDWRHADRIHGAADPGGSDDMFGAAIVARYDMVSDSGKPFKQFQVRGHGWTCEQRPEHIRTPQIARWIQDGLLSECTGDQVQFSDAVEWAVQQTAIYGVATWAYDHSWARVFGQDLVTRGLTVFKFTQSHFHYNNVVGVLESLLKEVHIVGGKPVRALVHDGDPVLAWHIMNMVIHRNAKGERMPDKSNPQNKIDIAVAVLMAISECLYSEDTGPSVYEKRGFIEIG